MSLAKAVPVKISEKKMSVLMDFKIEFMGKFLSL